MSRAGLDDRLSAEEFFELPEHENAELVRGRIVEVPLPGYEHGDLVTTLASVLKPFVRERGLGNLVAEVDFVLARDPDLVRRPDLAFLGPKKAAAAREQSGPLEMPPDLAIEVVSPNDKFLDVDAKASDYLASGVLLVWVLSPRERRVLVYRSGGAPMQILGAEHTIDAAGVIPGFESPVSRLFG